MDIIQQNRDAYNAIAKAFDATRYQARELVQFRPFLANGQYILDWGCGNGRLLHILQDFDVRYFGLDQSHELLKQAKKNPLAKAKKATFFCTAHKDKKFKADYFDLVFMMASFHHLPDEKSRLALLKKLFTEMKSGGKLIMTVWNLESDWAKEQFKKGWKKFNENDYWIPWKDQAGKILAERYYHHFSKIELQELLVKAGFTVVEMYYSAGDEKVPNKKDGRNLVVIAEK